jgi:hypothetical protein
MAWTAGKELFLEIVESIERHVFDEQLKTNIYYELVSTFEDYNVETLDECLGVSDTLDMVLYEIFDIEEQDNDVDLDDDL